MRDLAMLTSDNFFSTNLNLILNWFISFSCENIYSSRAYIYIWNIWNNESSIYQVSWVMQMDGEWFYYSFKAQCLVKFSVREWKFFF